MRPLNPFYIMIFILIYPAFFFVSILPVLVETTYRLLGSSLFRYDSAHGPDWAEALWLGGHTIYVIPGVTFLGVLSLFAQLAEMTFGTSNGAFSTQGLGRQALLFLVTGMSWVLRMTIPGGLRFDSWWGFGSWYQLVGWAAMDDLVFGCVQGVLFMVVWAWEGRGIVT